jgi:hypothetical protein
MSELGQLIDHAAGLRRDLDRVALELEVLALAVLALMLAVALLSWQLWRD